MPRHKYKKTRTKSDKVYNNYETAKLINYLMIDGEKSVSEKIVYDALEEIKKQGQDPLKTLHQAISNTSPSFEVKPRRLGGASYLVPIEVRRDRKLFLSLNWIIEAAKSRSNKEYHTFSKKLLAEIMEAAKNQGQGVAKKQSTEKLAENNRAFSHLKW
ncbi:MAG: 30S ribosomal protein S7 [Candidatus Roizmanbacteria bacterium GW2011_GWC2_37_13]|uniref:Small ribosomal subunit protein uS7 n=1 Tax=Candidatus Roizmanbacteria bacterium GW2011_GWC2_37_13 TaxID=1618486 RepID=A0A0G0G705_9BACT|nr:MAG: 30S ribosomal protein S7 [Candidatus Roizmanbacteria bacterium GW2011_GWC1_37_12]KKQ25832.1 MAG: 30S ribosomal protein S7 [Candidatus Roizmanbacteria bacterium GW2011_GWC2_37_13]